MQFLDDLLDNFFEEKGFTDFLSPVRKAAVQEQRNLKQGLIDIFKQDPATGQQVRLERPENNPLGFGEQFGLKPNFSNFLGQDAQAKTAPTNFNILKSLGQVTGLNGSPLWDKGLDVDLKIGDPVLSPVSGTIQYTGKHGGFGNQVQVKGDDGREWWLSHLSGFNVQPGMRINAGQPVGAGGNTGNVIPGPGGDGSHVDITVKDQNGKFLNAPDVFNVLNTFG